ncbi:MAG: AAA family ATPase [Desulfobacteraceae bacterium]|nr:AAA family ATPase [Desulfobacteraceae bacterium]
MKISIQNLGIIKKAEIEVKPFTIFIGHNNSGKTWTAYALSTIIGAYAMEHYAKACLSDNFFQEYPPLTDTLEKLEEQGTATIDMPEFVSQYKDIYIKNIASFAQDGLKEFMGTKKADFENLNIHADFQHDKKEFSEYIKSFLFEENLVMGQEKKPLLNALKEKGESILYFYSTAKGSISEEIPLRAVKEFLILSVFKLLHKTLNNSDYPYMYVFPTERTNYVSFSLNALEYLQSYEKEIHISQKVDNQKPESSASFDRMLMNAFKTGSKTKRQEEIKDNPIIETYISLADILEKEVLGGGVDFSTPEPEPWRELIFQANQNVQLDMPVVSSMVKELSPLVLYLRYLAKPNEMLIIDEPEMNLHPKAQVQLTEFLAMLVNFGLNILITTHSPYLVDHAANLIKASKKKNKKSIQDIFYLKNQNAFIPVDKVSVYLFEKGTANNILNKNGEINWETFSRISDEITDLYFDMDKV